MKTLLLLALSLLPAAAEIIGVEQFDYPDSNIAAKNDGTFWDYKNTAPVGHTGTASNWDSPVGTPTVTNGGLVTSGNSVAKREYRGANETEGAVNDANVAKTVYYRVTVTTGATVGSGDYFGISSMDFNSEKIYFGKRGGSTTWGVEEVGVDGTNGSLTIQPNTTYLLVAQIDFPGNAIRLWVNPDLYAAQNVPFNNNAQAATRTYTGTNWSTAVRFASGGAVTWDNLVVATTWEDLGTEVTTTADEDNGSLDPALGTGISLREAVNHSTAGSLITFAPALNGQTCTLSLGEMTLYKALTIDASALANGVTIDANRTSRHFFQGSPIAFLTLKSLSLINGNGVGDGNAAGDGRSLGGAIHLFTGSLFLERCTLSGNLAGSGGAIWLQGSGTRRLEECTLTGNRSTASVGTGGIVLFNATCTLSRCTISGNTGSGNGGGLFLQSPASVSLSNCLIAGNTDSAANDILRIDGTLTASGSNLIGSNASVSDFFSPGPLVGTAAAPLDPKLSPLGHFGGPVQTMHPLIGSPAIDAAGTTDPGGTDARGLPRFVDGDTTSSGAQLDIGAVEAGFASPVTSAIDSNATGTLRSRLANAEILGEPCVRIVFDPAVFPASTINLNGNQLTPPTGIPLFIDASNLSAPVTISGGGNSRVFNIPATATVAMHSVNIVNGKAADAAVAGNNGAPGGGIFNAGTLSLFSSTVANNRSGRGADENGESAGDGDGGDGGGIFSIGRLGLTACTVSGNTTGNGGNLFFDDEFSRGGHGGSGGGIFSGGSLTLTACTLSANATGNGGTASGIGSGGRGGDGAAIRDDSEIPYRLTACTIVGNQTGSGGNIAIRGDGGGLSSGTAILQNCLVAQNTGFGTAPDVNIISLTTVEANLLGTAPSFSGTNPGPAPTLNAAPNLAPLGDYGGPTQTMPPLPGSQAIDAGASGSRSKDQRGLPTVGFPDIGAAEYQGTTDLRLFWETDWDGDGNAFGLEFALGTDPMASDPANPRNLTFTRDANGNPRMTFGRNPAANSTTNWQLTRSTTLQPGSFETIFLFFGSAGLGFFLDGTAEGSYDSDSFEMFDINPPPGKAFYRIEAISP